MGFKEIDDARNILGLDEYASLEEIKINYRTLATKYHPDRCKGIHKKECEEMFKKISHAKDVLSNYCATYKYSFKEKDVKRNALSKEEYQHLKQFFDDWWGNLDL